MDSLTYHYLTESGKQTNKLAYVNDLLGIVQPDSSDLADHVSHSASVREDEINVFSVRL